MLHRTPNSGLGQKPHFGSFEVFRVGKRPLSELLWLLDFTRRHWGAIGDSKQGEWYDPYSAAILVIETFR